MGGQAVRIEEKKQLAPPWGILIAQMSDRCRAGAKLRETFVGREGKTVFPRSKKSELFTLTLLRLTLQGNVVKLTEQ